MFILKVLPFQQGMYVILSVVVAAIKYALVVIT